MRVCRASSVISIAFSDGYFAGNAIGCSFAPVRSLLLIGCGTTATASALSSATYVNHNTMDYPLSHHMKKTGDAVSNSAVIQRTLSVLEAVAASGSAAAKTVASRLEIPLPTVYRLLNELTHSGYLVYLKNSKRFELG